MRRSRTYSFASSVRVWVSLALALAAFASLGTSARATGSSSYALDDLAQGPSNGAGVDLYESGTWGINASGWVSGTTSATNPVTDGQAFVWKGSGTPTLLGALTRGGTSIGYRLNATGVVVGRSPTKQNVHAFRWINGTMTDLGQLGKGGYSIATDVNDSGLVVGETTVTAGSSQVQHAFRYDTAMHDIGTLAGDSISLAFGVNTTGTIVGMSWGPYPDGIHPFLYAGGAMSRLPTLPTWQNGRAYDINDNGVVVGKAQYATGSNNIEVDHAVMWDASHTNITDLTPGVYASGGLGVNSRGDVVGFVNDGTVGLSGYRGFIYTNGQYFDLTQLYDPTGTSGWVINSATGINDNGQIAAIATHNGQARIVRLSPAAPINVAAPSISGSPVIGQTLTATSGVWTNATTVTRQWERCGLDEAGCVGIVGATGTTYVPTTADDDFTVKVKETATGQSGSAQIESQATLPVVVASLLLQYSPVVTLASNETYSPDNAQEITDYFASPQTTSSNQLIDNSSFIRATPLGFPNLLTLGFLGQNAYGDGANPTPSSNDYIDEYNDQPAGYINLRQADPSLYGWKVYGRAVTPPGSTDLVLQYWFFYYYNGADDLNQGAHEGDWEGYQLDFPSGATTPGWATFFQHKHAETCSWPAVLQSGGHPVVFPAFNSHATYFRPGDYHVQETWGLVTDHANGSGPSGAPAVVDISLSPAPSWVTWPGRWGGTPLAGDPIEQSSPTGPGTKGQWADPLGWALANQTTCSVPGYFDRRLPATPATRGSLAPMRKASQPLTSQRPPTPQLTASLSGSRITVKYRFRTWPTTRERKPWLLYTSTVYANGQTPRVTKRTVLAHRLGQFTQPGGAIGRPSRIVFTVVAKSGRQSKAVTVAIKH